MSLTGWLCRILKFRYGLSHNEKRILHTNGNGDVRQVLAAIYGMNIAKKMIPIEATLGFQNIGYIVMPEVTRASRNYISTMINGRFIKNYASLKQSWMGIIPSSNWTVSNCFVEY